MTKAGSVGLHDNAQPPDGEIADRLGEILVRRGIVSRVDLDAALAMQPVERLPLGTLLMKRGLLDGVALREALGRQKGMRSTAFRLGDMLLAYGMISNADLVWALEQRRSTGMLLGAVLVRAGRLKVEQLRQALILQSTLRRRLLAASMAVMVGVMPMVSAVADDAADTQAVDVMIHVPERMNVTEGLSLGLPGTPGIDRVRLLQPLLPYAQTAETRIVTAQTTDGGNVFTLDAPGRVPIPIELRLMFDPTAAMVDLRANLETQVPGGVSSNSHLLEISFDHASLETLEAGNYATRIQLVIAPI